MLYSSDFKRTALDALSGRWALAIGTGFIAGVLGAGLNVFSNSNSRWKENMSSDQVRILWPIIFGVLSVAFFFFFVGLLFGGPVQLGYCRFNKNLINDTNPQFKDLFSCFDNFGKGFCMQLLIDIYVFLWTLLLIVPGIIAALSYAMTPYILEENPDLSVSEAIRQSKELMYGNKWRLFCLFFSFIGWAILSALTCGIGLLWLNPYISASVAAFYLEISGKKEVTGGNNIN